eukprot:TRINITY_DN552_c0_g1_i4.p1 TRINITY_DN552_c0_g1~~TRINITY_DN552_c0_g1_i4.p1  ORF type:complete len:357 (+),score=59.94 TRINITY_DN552_c0_g1_i4:294-1364(+)
MSTMSHQQWEELEQEIESMIEPSEESKNGTTTVGSGTISFQEKKKPKKQKSSQAIKKKYLNSKLVKRSSCSPRKSLDDTSVLRMRTFSEDKKTKIHDESTKTGRFISTTPNRRCSPNLLNTPQSRSIDSFSEKSEPVKPSNSISILVSTSTSVNVEYNNSILNDNELLPIPRRLKSRNARRNKESPNRKRIEGSFDLIKLGTSSLRSKRNESSSPRKIRSEALRQSDTSNVVKSIGNEGFMVDITQFVSGVTTEVRQEAPIHSTSKRVVIPDLKEPDEDSLTLTLESLEQVRKGTPKKKRIKPPRNSANIISHKQPPTKVDPINTDNNVNGRMKESESSTTIILDMMEPVKTETVL